MTEEPNGEQLDRHFMQQVKEYETVFRTKACPSDQEIIKCWMRILKAAPESQKLARNCLMLLIYGHLNEIGYLQKPFTDMRNCGKDLNDILDSYKGLPVHSAVKSTEKDVAAYEAETSKDVRTREKSFRDMHIVRKNRHKIMDSYKGLSLFKEDKSTQKDAAGAEAGTSTDLKERDKHFGDNIHVVGRNRHKFKGMPNEDKYTQKGALASETETSKRQVRDKDKHIRYLEILGKNRYKILNNWKGLPLIKEDESTKKHVAFCEAEISKETGEKDESIKDLVDKYRYKIYDNFKGLTLSKEGKANQKAVFAGETETSMDLKDEKKRNKNFRDVHIEERILDNCKGLSISKEDKSTQSYAAACEACEKNKAFAVVKNRNDVLDMPEEQPRINKGQSTQKDASTDKGEDLEEKDLRPYSTEHKYLKKIFANVRNFGKNCNEIFESYTGLPSLEQREKDKSPHLNQQPIKDIVPQNAAVALKAKTCKDLENKALPSKDNPISDNQQKTAKIITIHNYLPEVKSVKPPVATKNDENSYKDINESILHNCSASVGVEAYETFDSHHLYTRAAADPMQELNKIIDTVINDENIRKSQTTLKSQAVKKTKRAKNNKKPNGNNDYEPIQLAQPVVRRFRKQNKTTLSDP